MKEIYKRFFRDLLNHSDDLAHYVNELYEGDQYTNSDLNSIFGVLRKEGVVSYLEADNGVYCLSITFEGKHYFDGDTKKTDNRLSELIDNIDEVELLFHHVPGISLSPSCDMIHDIQDYQDWIMEIRLELQNIYDRLHDQFIWETIRVCDKKMNGYNDKQIFSEIKAWLNAINRNINKYFPENDQSNLVVAEGDNMKRKPLIFISHSTKNKEQVSDFVNLLRAINLQPKTEIFCSSLPGYDLGIDSDIIESLRQLFHDYDLHVIIFHSHEYYQSTISLNEMGAAWALRKTATSILLGIISS